MISELSQHAKLEQQAQTEAVVYDNITFLAPYFGVSPLSNSWLRYRMPKVTLTDIALFDGRYSVRRNEITLRKGYKNDTTIPHEVGHWWHRMLNPPLFRIFNKLEELDVKRRGPTRAVVFLSEIIALHCEGLFLGSNLKDKIGNLGLTLQDLIRIDFAGAKARKKELDGWYTAMHKLRYPENYNPKTGRSLVSEALDKLGLHGD